MVEPSNNPSGDSKPRASNPITVWNGAPISTGYSDISDQVDRRGLELLNANNTKGSAVILFQPSAPSSTSAEKGKSNVPSESSEEPSVDWVESDTDEQLMLYIPFQSTLKLHTIQVTSILPSSASSDEDDPPMRPRTFKFYINRPHNLGFEEAEDTPPTQTITLEAKDWDEKTDTARLELRFVKFQNVVSLIVFVVDGDGDGDKVRIDRLRLIGESGISREVPKLEKITDH